MEVLNKIEITNRHKAVLKTLAYFEVFQYPLTLNDIHSYQVQSSYSLQEIRELLEELSLDGLIYLKDSFYSLSNNSEAIIRRVKGNKKAVSYLDIAFKKSKFISKFPFVKAIMISGSLSKGFVDEKGDIDYFIITSANRLWLTRTLLILYKKVFLLNSRKYFCLNYFIDENTLEIENKNIYTALETLTLIPTYNPELCAQFMSKNEWSKTYFPNIYEGNLSNKTLTSIRKSLFEFLLNNQLGNWLDSQFMNLTYSFWKRKFKDYSSEDFNHSFKTSKTTSRHHPSDFQKKVLNRYNEIINEIESNLI